MESSNIDLEKCDLLQDCANRVVSKLFKSPSVKVVNSVHLQMTKTNSSDIVFTSNVTLSSNCDGTHFSVKGLGENTRENGYNETDSCAVNYSKLETILDTESDLKLSEVVAGLPEDSKEWPLCVDKCVFQHHKVLLFLNRKKGFSTVLPHILRQGQEYGRFCKRRASTAQIVLTCENMSKSTDDMSLRQLRLQYLNTLLRNLLDANGCKVLVDAANSSDDVEYLHLATKSSEQLLSNQGKMLRVGDVVSHLGSENVKLSAGDFLRHRHQDVRQLSDVKCADRETLPVGNESLSHLAVAVTKIELLQVKPLSKVCVDLCSPHENQRLRGALFVLYNYTRISAILQLFQDKVREGVYPALVPIQQIDFSLLKQQEEWCLLSRYLLVFPQLVESCIYSSRPISAHRICLFLSELSRVYSGYYRRVRILTEPREHLLPVMFARLYLLRAVEQVFYNALSLLDITPLEHM